MITFRISISAPKKRISRVIDDSVSECHGAKWQPIVAENRPTEKTPPHYFSISTRINAAFFRAQTLSIHVNTQTYAFCISQAKQDNPLWKRKARNGCTCELKWDMCQRTWSQKEIGNNGHSRLVTIEPSRYWCLQLMRKELMMQRNRCLCSRDPVLEFLWFLFVFVALFFSRANPNRFKFSFFTSFLCFSLKHELLRFLIFNKTNGLFLLNWHLSADFVKNCPIYSRGGEFSSPSCSFAGKNSFICHAESCVS